MIVIIALPVSNVDDDATLSVALTNLVVKLTSS